jgi:hypothetical protein
MPFPSSVLSLAFVVVLAGTITDKTTGQPLAGVDVVAGSAHARSHADGTFRLVGVRPGPLTLTVSSDDVPPQRFPVTVGSATTHTVLHACSTTLDYDCGPPQ